MSLHKSSTDRPVETSQSTNNKQTYRLYPSLPNTDRCESGLLGRSLVEKRPTAAEFHPQSLLEDTQCEDSSPSSDVRMKAHIVILEEQRRELLSINEQWAKEYRTMVHYYKEKVQALKALQQHGHADEGDRHLQKKLTFNVDADKDNAQTGEGDVVSELLKAEKDANELRVQNGALTRKGQHQHEEIRRLNKALQEALLSPAPLGVSGEALQDAWKYQAEANKEDFFTERRDREKLHDKYLDLQQRFRKVHDELHVLKTQATWTLRPGLQCSCANPAKCPNRDVRPVKQHHVQLQRHRALRNEQ